MQNKLGIIVVSKHMKEDPMTRWQKVLHSINSMKNLVPDPKIIVVANVRDTSRHRPLADLDKTEMVTRKTWVRQDMVIDALTRMKNYEIQHSMILTAGFEMQSIASIKENKFTILNYGSEGLNINRKSMNGDFMYGKTRTLLRLWENRPFDKTIPLEKNIYKNVKNLFGEQGMNNNSVVDVQDINELTIGKTCL